MGPAIKAMSNPITMTILRAESRIAELEDALHEIFHYTDSTESQMAIIEKVLPQRVAENLCFC